MATIPVIQLTNIGTANVSGNWSLQPAQRNSILFNGDNPSFPRNVILDTSGLTISRPSQTPVQITMQTLINAAATANPNLTFAPEDVLDPSNLTVCNLGAAGFISNFFAETAITFQWQDSINAGTNWTNLSNAGVYSNVTTNTLNISNANTLNATWYRVIAMNAAGSTNSNFAVLTTVPDPTITLQPVSQPITHPAGCTFNIAALGLTSFSYQWQSNNGAGFSNATANASFPTVTTNSLFINTVTTNMANFQFRCLATDSAGTATSNAATLTVL